MRDLPAVRLSRLARRNRPGAFPEFATSAYRALTVDQGGLKIFGSEKAPDLRASPLHLSGLLPNRQDHANLSEGRCSLHRYRKMYSRHFPVIAISEILPPDRTL